MKVRIIHAEGHTYAGQAYKEALCGKFLLPSSPTTADHSKVTCKICLKRIAKNTK